MLNQLKQERKKETCDCIHVSYMVNKVINQSINPIVGKMFKNKDTVVSQIGKQPASSLVVLLFTLYYGSAMCSKTEVNIYR